MYKASSRCLRVIAENTPVRVNIAPIAAEMYAIHFNAFIDFI